MAGLAGAWLDEGREHASRLEALIGRKAEHVGGVHPPGQAIGRNVPVVDDFTDRREDRPWIERLAAIVETRREPLRERRAPGMPLPSRRSFAALKVSRRGPVHLLSRNDADCPVNAL